MKRHLFAIACAAVFATASFAQNQMSASPGTAAPSAATQPPAATPGRGFAARGRGRAASPAIKVTADHPDWNYLPGDPVKFSVTLPPGTKFTYTIGPDMMKLDSKEATIPPDGTLTLDGGTMDHPGFLRLTVKVAGTNFTTASNLATAAFSPEKIKPTQVEPPDFDAFWDKAKAELAALPIDAKITPMPDASTDTLDVSAVSLQDIGREPGTTSRFYGILAVPKGPGPFPAMMVPPGAGTRGPNRDFVWANRGYVTLYVGIHESPIIQDPNAPPAAPVPNDYQLVGLDDPNHYYFRRVFMGCVRANDFLLSLPKVDKNKLVGLGGSQGGMLTIDTAALDPREKAIVVSFPAYCDVTGYIHGRAGGWPKLLFDDMADPLRDKKIATTAYFDTVNFAKRIKIPGHYGWGYNDETCPPDSVFSAYNSITAPKELSIFKAMGHPRVPGLTEIETAWMLKQVGNMK